MENIVCAEGVSHVYDLEGTTLSRYITDTEKDKSSPGLEFYR